MEWVFFTIIVLIAQLTGGNVINCTLVQICQQCYLKYATTLKKICFQKGVVLSLAQGNRSTTFTA